MAYESNTVKDPTNSYKDTRKRFELVLNGKKNTIINVTVTNINHKDEEVFIVFIYFVHMSRFATII